MKLFKLTDKIRRHLVAQILLVVLSIFSITAPLQALPEEYYKLFGEAVRFYDTEEGCPTGGDPAAPVTGTSLEDAEQIGFFEGPQMTPTKIILHWTAVAYDDPLVFAQQMADRTTPDIHDGVNNAYPNGRAVQLTIDTDGKIYQLSKTLETRAIQTVDDPAWNDGVAIEIESSTTDDTSVAANDLLTNSTQYAAVLSTVKQLMTKYGIKNEQNMTAKTGIFGHHEIHAPNSDPGAEYMAKIRADVGDTSADTPSATAATSTGGGCACTDPSLSGSNNVEIAFNYFVSKGLTEEQAAGIVGNLMRESGPDVDPKAYSTYEGLEYRGVAQWNPSRWANLVKLAEANGKDPLSLEAQLDYIWFELTGEPPTEGATGGGYKHVYDELKTTTTVDNATIVFEEKFEISADTLENGGVQIRIDYAKEVFALYADGGGGAISGGSCVNLGSAGPFSAFPLVTTKPEILDGSCNSAGCLAWNTTTTSNFHHNYNAADIHDEPGVPVVAALAGTVVSTTEAVGGVGSRVVLKSSDGKYINYYTHMSYGSIAVKSGDTVAAGQRLGTIGPPEQAVGTAPHLHIDLLPSPPYESRPSCSGAGCAAYPFILIQGWLVELYDTLVPES